ncbi:MAG: Asp23/Gls24 family envelope stress response protein [bacterium]|nr:Asp23/Gls24 family envelope stress response protein [bacterium]
MGTIRIADEVIGIIAGLAASEVSGVVGMSGASLSDILGRKSPSKGVKVVVGESEAAIDLYIVVEYGMRLNEVAEAVQDNVRRAVESMTGLAVVEVNVHVQGVGVLDPTNL